MITVCKLMAINFTAVKNGNFSDLYQGFDEIQSVGIPTIVRMNEEICLNKTDDL